MTETELIQALKNKDSQAFQYVYDLYYKKIKSLCYGKVGNTEDAEDLTQEDFLVFSPNALNIEYYSEETDQYASAGIADEDIIEYLIYSGISAEEIDNVK